MPFIDANDAAQIAERIISIDRIRLADDPFKLTLALFHLVESRLAAYNSAVQRLSVASGTRSSNSQHLVMKFHQRKPGLQIGLNNMP